MRRANGTGTIKKLSGTRRNPWVAYAPATFDDWGRETRPVVGYFRTRPLAEKALSDYLDTPYDTDKAATMTLADVYEEWIKRATRGKSDKYADSLDYARKMLAPLEKYKMRDIRHGDLQDLIDDIIDKGYSYSTVSKVKTILKGIYKYAINNEIIVKDYTAALYFGKSTKSTIHQVIETAQIQFFWQHRDETDCANALIMIYTGMRPNEAIIQPITQDDKDRGWFVAIGNKTESSKGRIVPIHPAIREILQSRDRLIVSKRTGGSLSYERLYAVMKTFGIKPHDPRHTLGTLMKKYHCEEYARKRILGHTGGNITDDVYTHVDGTYLLEEMLKVPFPMDL